MKVWFLDKERRELRKAILREGPFPAKTPLWAFRHSVAITALSALLVLGTTAMSAYVSGAYHVRPWQKYLLLSLLGVQILAFGKQVMALQSLNNTILGAASHFVGQGYTVRWFVTNMKDLSAREQKELPL